MRTSQRRREILSRLAETGYVEAKDLSRRLQVDASTIRRDLEALAAVGQLERTHGGARLTSGAADIPYAVKERARIGAKMLIGAAAAHLVSDGDSVLLDSGSTTYQLAVALRTCRDLTIVTNDLRIAILVADYPDVRLLVAGGERLPSTFTLAGEAAVAFMSMLRTDWTFLGADAIDVSAGITNTNTVEVPLKRAMIAAGGTTVVLADSSKLGERALAQIADIDDVDRILTDDEVDPDLVPAFGPVLEVVSETSVQQTTSAAGRNAR
jgi:DeoR family transcriptional regulator, aga operon transcriptional repressor